MSARALRAAQGDLPAFTAEESRYVAAIGRYLGDGLRTNLARQRYGQAAGGGRGMLVLDETGRVEAATPEATRWLRLLPSPEPGKLPIPIAMVALRAQTNTAEGDPRAARVRMRLTTGDWLLAHADLLVAEPPDASPRVAVMLEPAGPAEMLPLMLALHGLTDRERQVTELLVAGHGLPYLLVRNAPPLPRSSVKHAVRRIRQASVGPRHYDLRPNPRCAAPAGAQG